VNGDSKVAIAPQSAAIDECDRGWQPIDAESKLLPEPIVVTGSSN
jgi:hypothetical protein